VLSCPAGFGVSNRSGEGTGTYGAVQSRFLRRKGVQVVKADRPDRKTRRMKSKFDSVDAYAAALAALARPGCGIPKSRNTRVEATRVLRVTRRSAVKSPHPSTAQLRALLLTGPAQLREIAPEPRCWDSHRPLRQDAHAADVVDPDVATTQCPPGEDAV
jgi:transposase